MPRLGLLIGAAAAIAAAAVAPGPLAAQDATLALRMPDGAAEVFWRASQAPRHWQAADARVIAALEWHPTSARAIEWAELALQGAGEARFTRVVVVRIDPRAVRFSLELRTTDARPAWNIDQAQEDAIVALNAGMFTGALPWGWLVQSGTERLAPGHGPLSSAFIVRRDGGVEWVDGDALDAHRARHDLSIAFQSYPSVLVGNGTVPAMLHTDAAAAAAWAARPPREADLDRGHRDARLALGVDRDGRVLVVLTRFDGLGGFLDRIPLGLTVPEMSGLMGALGARQAMLLDGGISAQLLLRTPGSAERFSGSRRVPLALVVRDAQ